MSDVQILHDLKGLSRILRLKWSFLSKRRGLTMPYQAREEPGEDATIATEERFERYVHRPP